MLIKNEGEKLVRTLKKPTDLPKVVFSNCISNYRDQELKQRLLSYTTLIETHANTYEELVLKANLHLFDISNQESEVMKSEMIDVYKNKFSKKGQPGRIYYDKLISQSKKCPLCGQRVVSSLDHHLPKSIYPTLAVTPINLVPACSDCNKIKESFKPKNAEEETLHPYFDNIEDAIWLEAEVIHSNPVSFNFFVSPPLEWDELKKQRVVHHFCLFELGPLYSLYAGEELTMYHLLFVTLFNKSSTEGLRQHLLDCQKGSEDIHLNSWRAAMYRALARSEWYCNGGIIQMSDSQ